MIERESLADWLIAVPEDLQVSSRLIRHSLARLKQAKPDAFGQLHVREEGCFTLRLFKESIELAGRILQAFTDALKRRGIPLRVVSAVAPHDRHIVTHKTLVEIEGEEIEIAFEEGWLRSPAEKGNKPADKWGWQDKWTYAPAGKLRWRIIDGVYSSSGQQVACGPSALAKRGALNRFMVSLCKKACDMKREREERRIREEDRQREEALRAERQRLQRILDAKIELIEKQAGHWEKSLKLRVFAEACQKRALEAQVPMEQSSSAAEWLSLIQRLADHYDPLVGSAPWNGFREIEERHRPWRKPE